jgi:hypothetical protein
LYQIFLSGKYILVLQGRSSIPFMQWFFLEKFRKCIFPRAGNGWIKKLMVPSESALQELSSEWSCQYVGNFCVRPLNPKYWVKNLHVFHKTERNVCFLENK